jgi:hypothetical protein
METSQIRAREIMGQNFFGIEEAIKHFRVNPTGRQIVALAQIPFSETELERHKKTHLLVAVFPLSIQMINGRIKENILGDKRVFDCCQGNQPFARERGRVEWILIRKSSAPGAYKKTWAQQQAIISRKNEIPDARIMVYAIIGHYLATGIKLFHLGHVRTASVSPSYEDKHIHVGGFKSRGLRIDVCYDEIEYEFGIASIRKPENPKN